MIRFASLFLALYGFLLASAFAAPKDEAPRPKQATVSLSEIIHRDFADCVVDPNRPRPRFYNREEFELVGGAKRLNALLEECSKLPTAASTKIYLSGPRDSIFTPLTSAAAQSPAQYDWRVQILGKENISIYIPLAARIPFAEIEFPASLSIEAYPEVQPIVKDFIRLREQENKATTIKQP